MQIGLASYKTYNSIDRPTERVVDGLQYLYRLVEEYPDSPYTDQARKYIHDSRIILAKHELYVADFYWSTSQYGGAWKRYSYVLEQFGDLESVSEYARKRAELSYLRYQAQRSDTVREETEGSWKDFFRWL
jgi:outer membrane protein assembly factor BamD